MTCLCGVNEKLEAERLSWREPFKPLPEVIVRGCTRQHATPAEACQRQHVTKSEQDKRDQVMFNAGRYAAGARDSVALEAHNKLFELFGKEEQ